MNKAYSRINFQNAPSTATPLNATNLNKIDKAINDLDDRIIELSGYQEEAQEAAEQASSSASAAAKAAETATADAEARVNEVIQGLEVYTKADSHKKFASVIKQVATGSPILITDSSDATAIDFKGKGRSTQDGTPTPDSPIDIKSVADGGYFDGELATGYYNNDGTVNGTAQYISVKNLIPCNVGDVIKFTYAETVTKLVILFFDDTKYLSQVGADNSAIVNATAPSGATRFGITIQSIKGITPQTAKHITVTINGKYALIVKSNGKNLLSINERDKATTYFNYTEYTNEIVKGSAIPTTNGAFLCSYSAYLEKGKTYTFSQESVNGMQLVGIYSDKLWGNGISTLFNVTVAPNYTHNADSGIYIIGYFGDITSGTEYSVVKPMLRLAEVTDDTYEPYKETVTYIPLNEPLRSSLDGTVKDEVSLTECKVDRKNGIVNAKDLTWSIFTYGTAHINTTMFKSNEVSDMLVTDGNIVDSMCNRFNTLPNGFDTLNIDGEWTIHAGNKCFYICINNDRANTVDKLLAWLDSNPTYFQYLLAEPVVETIEPVDIVTYDNVTYISNADNAEMEVTYATDIKSYIDSKFAELHAALVNML